MPKIFSSMDVDVISVKSFNFLVLSIVVLSSFLEYAQWALYMLRVLFFSEMPKRQTFPPCCLSQKLYRLV